MARIVFIALLACTLRARLASGQSLAIADLAQSPSARILTPPISLMGAGKHAEISTPQLIVGGVLGGAAGLLVGTAIGWAVGANSCGEAGNPDSCRGFEGAVGGASLGMAVGIPVGVHLANDRDGSLATSLVVSVAMPLIVHAVAKATSDDRVYSALLVVPLAQVVTSVLIEKR